MAERALLVGIGSAHGDDQVGWLVIDETARRLEGVVSRRARKPAELLDWLDDEIDRLVVCDAVASDDRPSGSVDSWKWPTSELAGVRFGGTHDLSLVATLRLAEELGLLPPEVQIWGVAICSARAMDRVSSEIIATVPRIAERICRELKHA